MSKNPQTDPARDAAMAVVGGFLEVVDRLSAQDTRRLAAEWEGGDEPRRSAARRAVRQAAEASGRSEQLGWLEGHLQQWARGRTAGVTQGALFGRMDDVDLTLARAPGAPAVIDAGAALLVRDGIPAADFDALFGAWGRAIVIGRRGSATAARVGPGGTVARMAGFLATGVPFNHDQDR